MIVTEHDASGLGKPWGCESPGCPNHKKLGWKGDAAHTNERSRTLKSFLAVPPFVCVLAGAGG